MQSTSLRAASLSALKGFKVDLSFNLPVTTLHLEDLGSAEGLWSETLSPYLVLLSWSLQRQGQQSENKNIPVGIHKVSPHFYQEFKSSLTHTHEKNYLTAAYKVIVSSRNYCASVWRLLWHLWSYEKRFTKGRMSHFMDVRNCECHRITWRTKTNVKPQIWESERSRSLPESTDTNYR